MGPPHGVQALTLTLFYRRREHFLEAGQPETQHGFRPGRGLENTLFATTLTLDNSDTVGITLKPLAWICRGDFLLMKELSCAMDLALRKVRTMW